MRALPVVALMSSLAIPIAHDSLRTEAPGILVGPITGTVYDSLRLRPLSGAMVQFVGAADSVVGRVFSATTDSAGKYTIADIPAGAYLAGFFHPAVDSLGIELSQSAVVINQANQVVHLATPSPLTLAAAVCPEGNYADSLGMLIGHVRHTQSGEPLHGAVVTVSWNETVIGQGGIHSRQPEIMAVTGPAGWYGICGLPKDVALMARAVYGVRPAGVASETADTSRVIVDTSVVKPDSSGYVEVTLGGAEIRGLGFLVGGSITGTITAADTVVGRAPTAADTGLLVARRGAARLEGRVVDARGERIPEARVQVWGAARYGVATTNGTFMLDSLPGGTHALEVRAIGFVPVKQIVHLRPEETTPVEVVLGERAVALPTVTVRGQLVYSRKLAGFEDRRRKGVTGLFFGPEDIENRPFTRVTDLLSQIAGVSANRGNSDQVLFRQGSLVYDPGAISDGGDGVLAKTTACEPTWYVDGRRSFLTAQQINDQYTPLEIAAVEVYQRQSQIPLEFHTPLSGCGIVAIWTRPPPAKIKAPKK